jgi:hypothetical protein
MSLSLNLKFKKNRFEEGVLSYNKSQRDALFLKFIFGKELYMFRTDLVSIIRSFNTVYTAIGICHTSYAAFLLAR